MHKISKILAPFSDHSRDWRAIKICKMAGVMDEYDPATPVNKVYCARLSTEQYEDQASEYTEEALVHLIQYLDKNPDSYRRVMTRRKREEEESGGLFSFVKVVSRVHKLGFFFFKYCNSGGGSVVS